MRDRLPRRRAGLAAAALALTLGGCGGQQSILSTHSRQSHDISTLWWWMLAIATVVFLGAVGMLVVAYFTRHSEGLPLLGKRENVNEGLVVLFGIAIPIVVLVALFGVSNVYLVNRTGPPSPQKTALTIRVIGHQYWWEVHYPNGAITANEIHIPVNTAVNVVATTADVIHSFWVPALNRKIDMIPGRENRVLLDASSSGVYRGQCAQFCGFQHAHMSMLVDAQPKAQFDAWLANMAQAAREPTQHTNAEAVIGRQVFMASQCSSCHRISGTQAQGFIGPDLSHFATRRTIAADTIPNTPAELAAWIENPQAIKPGNRMPDLGLSQTQIGDLVAYLESLG